MSDTPTAIDTNPSLPATAPVQTPVQAAPVAQTGSGAAPGARPPTGAVPSQTPADREVDLSEVLEWAPGEQASLKDLIKAHQEFRRVQESGYDLYQRAVRGDQQAAREWLNRHAGPGVGTVSTQPVQQVQQSTPPPNAGLPPEIQAKLAYIDQIQARDARNGLAEQLKNPEYSALSQRDDAVDLVLERLDQLHRNKTPITPQTVQMVLKNLNDNEAAYQQKLFKNRGAGDLGTSDPFRGGSPQLLNEPRPDPFKDKAKYNQWLKARVGQAILASEESGYGG